jgi:nitrogen-specific signal transduction histidine kinase
MKEAFVTTKAEGLGLGLAIVNAAAQVHKGTLSWKREQNWTTMELTLPVNQESGDPA